MHVPEGAPPATRTAARRFAVGLWAAVVSSLPAWIIAGYPWPICVLAALPLLAPLPGLLRGRRRTYAWATLFTIPYVAFTVTELLVNPAARWVAGSTLLLVFAWFCAMVAFLRISPAHHE